MEWCERCGRYFARRSGKAIKTSARARGPVRDITDSVCDDCLRYGEWFDESGRVRTGPRDEDG